MYKGDLVCNKRTGVVGVVYDQTYDSARDHFLVRVYYSGAPKIWIRSSCFDVIAQSSEKRNEKKI
jgi:hypothetical protein